MPNPAHSLPVSSRCLAARPAHEVLRETVITLNHAGISNSASEARWLLQHESGVADKDFAVFLRRQCPPEVISRLQARVQRRCLGEPLQHILGTVNFFGYELEVGPEVLIPRQETEVLVETALRLYPGSGMICDLCTGSGAVAIAMSLELDKKPFMAAGDISWSALTCARKNQKHHQVDNLSLFQGDLAEAFRPDRGFTLITANPPYISAEEYAGLPAEVRNYDPPISLIAKDNGLAMLRRTAAEAMRLLKPGGWLVCEIGENQKEAMAEILVTAGFNNTEILPDLSGRPRIAIAQKIRCVSGCIY